MREAREPILTETYDAADLFRPTSNALYVFGRSPEPRSSHLASWQAYWPTSMLLELSELENADSEIRATRNSSVVRVGLRSEAQLSSLWESAPSVVYVDITGLSHHVWAPIIKSLLAGQRELRVVYVEPGKYTRSRSPTEAQPYDLSERIRGIMPLPGLASLADDTRESLFIPLLGFEGARFAYVVEQIQPNSEHIYPVVGLPGFQPLYVYETYLGNRRILAETGSWQRAEYVPADCPFAAYRALDRIANRNPKYNLKIAIIGTKPHAVGAVLYKILRRQDAELIYDHPVRSTNRTSGTDKLHVYHISALKR